MDVTSKEAVMLHLRFCSCLMSTEGFLTAFSVVFAIYWGKTGQVSDWNASMQLQVNIEMFLFINGSLQRFQTSVKHKLKREDCYWHDKINWQGDKTVLY